MTQNATNVINPITFETLTNTKCLVDTFDRHFSFEVEHIAVAKRADLVLVAPASANVIGKLAHGIADDMLTTTLMACTCPKLLSPAMNTAMFRTTLRLYSTMGIKLSIHLLAVLPVVIPALARCRNQKIYYLIS